MRRSPVVLQVLSTLTLSPDTSFKIRFEQLASIKSLVDVVGSVLSRVYIQLKGCKREPGSVVLTIDTIDPRHQSPTSMCYAKLTLWRILKPQSSYLHLYT